MQTRYSEIASPVGPLTLVAEGDAICGVYFQQHHHMPDDSVIGAPTKMENDAVLANAADALHRYFDGDTHPFDLNLQTHGDTFQEKVWRLLRDIPYGETTTYGRIAEQLGDRYLAQNVGRAVGRNPLSIFIPCHRVIGANGSLTGYAGGLERKQFLLDLEQPGRARSVPLFQLGK